MWGIIIGLISLVITLAASSKFLSKLIIGYVYRPKIEISLVGSEGAAIYWKRLKGHNTPFEIKNNSKYDHRCELEFEIVTQSGKMWEFKSEDQNQNYEYRRSGTKLLYKKDSQGGNPIYLTGSKKGIVESWLPSFPVEPKSEPSTVTVRVYPKLELRELGFPRGFGEAQLKSVSETYAVISDENIESD